MNLTAFNRFKFYGSKRRVQLMQTPCTQAATRRRCFADSLAGGKKCDIIFSIVRVYFCRARGRATYRTALLNVNGARPPSIIILGSLFSSGGRPTWRPRRTLNSLARIGSRWISTRRRGSVATPTLSRADSVLLTISIHSIFVIMWSHYFIYIKFTSNNSIKKYSRTWFSLWFNCYICRSIAMHGLLRSQIAAN